MAMTNVLRQARLTQYVDAFLPGEITDWPAYVQDRMYLALHERRVANKCDYLIVASGCAQDIDNKWYLYVVASANIVSVH